MNTFRTRANLRKWISPAASALALSLACAAMPAPALAQDAPPESILDEIDADEAMQIRQLDAIRSEADRTIVAFQDAARKCDFGRMREAIARLGELAALAEARFNALRGNGISAPLFKARRVRDMVEGAHDKAIEDLANAQKTCATQGATTGTMVGTPGGQGASADNGKSLLPEAKAAAERHRQAYLRCDEEGMRAALEELRAIAARIAEGVRFAAEMKRQLGDRYVDGAQASSDLVETERLRSEAEQRNTDACREWAPPAAPPVLIFPGGPDMPLPPRQGDRPDWGPPPPGAFPMPPPPRPVIDGFPAPPPAMGLPGSQERSPHEHLFPRPPLSPPVTDGLPPPQPPEMELPKPQEGQSHGLLLPQTHLSPPMADAYPARGPQEGQSHGLLFPPSLLSMPVIDSYPAPKPPATFPDGTSLEQVLPNNPVAMPRGFVPVPNMAGEQARSPEGEFNRE